MRNVPAQPAQPISARAKKVHLPTVHQKVSPTKRDSMVEALLFSIEKTGWELRESCAYSMRFTRHDQDDTLRAEGLCEPYEAYAKRTKDVTRKGDINAYVRDADVLTPLGEEVALALALAANPARAGRIAELADRHERLAQETTRQREMERELRRRARAREARRAAIESTA